MKTRILLSVLLGFGAAAVSERDASAAMTSSLNTPFCYDSHHPQVILSNDVASLSWTGLGTLVLTNTAGSNHSDLQWGFTPATALAISQGQPLPVSTLCFDIDGVLRIRDNHNNLVWASSSPAQGNPVRLNLDHCNLETQQLNPTWSNVWNAATHMCSYAWRDNSGGAGWCMARPSGANVPVLWSQEDSAELDWQTDGNLVLYATDGRGAQWASNTFGTGANLCFQNDGNLVVYNASGGAVFSAQTGSKGVNQLVVDGGGVSLTAPMSGVADRKELWRQGTQMTTQTAVSNGWCRTNDVSSWILATDKAYLAWQTDGNLVVYDRNGGRARWAAGSNGAKILCFQDDGNLVTYLNANATSPNWSSGTYGHSNARLTMDSYTISISDQDSRQTLWSRTPSDALEGLGNGAFSFVNDKHFGDTNFGAELWVVAAGADANSIANLQAKGNTDAKVGHLNGLYLPSGTVANNFAEVMGDAGVNATLLSSTKTIVELSGYVGNAGSQSNSFKLEVYGHSTRTGTVGVDFSPPSVSATFVEASAQFDVGPIPIEVSAEVTGTVGVDAQAVAGSSGFNVTVTPNANLTASGSVSTGVACVSAGIEGEVNLINVSVPLSLDLSIGSNGSSTQYTMTGNLDISTLDGSIDLFANACLAEWKMNIASWNGVTYTASLFNQSGTM
jgi:hypothetical protein